MLIKTEELKIENKGRLKGISKKTGNEYDLPQLQMKTNEGINYTITLPNEMLYEKATIGKQAKIVYYIDLRGNTTINDIEIK